MAGSLPGDCLSRTMGIVMRPEEFWVEDDEIEETDTHDDRKSGQMSLGRKTSYYGANTGTTFTVDPNINDGKYDESSSGSELSFDGETKKSEEPELGHEDPIAEVVEDVREVSKGHPETTAEPDTIIEEGRRVLLVEDNWAHSKIAEKRLEKLGCEVRLATNGHKALLMLRDKIQKPDLIFMDLEMPLLVKYLVIHRTTIFC